MNKRITEKVYKRKFQILFAKVMSYLLDRHIKPSRIKLNLYVENKEAAVMACKTQGMEIKLKIYKSHNGRRQDDKS